MGSNGDFHCLAVQFGKPFLRNTQLGWRTTPEQVRRRRRHHQEVGIEFLQLPSDLSTTHAADVSIEQQRFMSAVFSDERPWDYIEAVYLTGTIDEIQQQVQRRIDAGVEYLILHTMTADKRQLDLFAKHILEPFTRVSTAA